jgi:hypothetical protein
MRAFLIILVSALMLGLAGGYAWSVMTAPSARAPRVKETTIAIPPSPEERPELLDQEWEARAANESAPDANAAAPDSNAAAPIDNAVQ